MTGSYVPHGCRIITQPGRHAPELARQACADFEACSLNLRPKNAGPTRSVRVFMFGNWAFKY